VGGRFTRDTKNAERYWAKPSFDAANFGELSFEEGAATGAANRQRFSRFNPSLTFDFRWTDDVSTYAKVATGYKAGGSSEAVQFDNFSQTFGPEELTNYEIGLKSYWFERTLRANITGFYSKLKDKQIGIATNPTPPSETQVFNAGRLFVKGIETELLYAPIEDLSFNFNYTFMTGAFTQVKAPAGTILDGNLNPLVPYQPGDNVKDLFVLPFAPKHSVDVSVDYTFLRMDSATLSGNLNYRWQDSVYVEAAAGRAVPGRNFDMIPSYGVLNGRLTLAMDLPRGDKAKISLWGKNIANKNYYQYLGGSPGPLVPYINTDGVAQPAGFTESWVAWSEPPMWGIDLTYEY